MMYFVAAYDQKLGMGSNSRPLPWPLMPADKAHLHELADGKHIVLGEKTYHDYKDIRGAFHTTRITVVSKTVDTLPDAKVVNSLEEIIQQAKMEDLWVIGGGSIFTQLLPYVDVMHLTRVEGEFEADVFFPKYSLKDWSVEKWAHQADEENPYPYTFLTLLKRD